MKNSAIYRIVIKDFVVSIRSGKFWTLAGFVFIFASVSLWLGQSQYNRVSTIKAEAIQQARHQWENQGEKNPHGAGHFGSVAFKPITPLYMIEAGLTDYVGEWVYLETHKQNSAEKRPANDRSVLFRFGQITPGFLFRFLIPLFVILLGYSTFSSEKEQNTLRMLLSQSITSKELFYGKLLSMFLQLAIMIVPVFLVTMGMFLMQDFSPFIPHMFILFMAYVLYLSTFVFIAIGISARSRTSGSALILLFAFWLISTILIPRLTVTISEILSPPFSSFDLKVTHDEKQDNKYVYGYKGRDDFSEMYAEIESELMQEYGVGDADSLEVNPFGFAIEKTEEEGQIIYDKTFGQINDLYKSQNKLHRKSVAFSPLSALHFLSMGLAHNDLQAHEDFLDQAEEYRRDLMKTLNMDIAYNSRKGKNNEEGNSHLPYVQGEEFWKSIRTFEYDELGLIKIISNHKYDVISLFLWFFASAFFANWSVKKLKIN
ncbi:ABC transporter permease subunit [Membranihabitans marinus]|uniref:ABC transporter permease subunit n=1 Tax=Membranihabitans marinus TaxID=1227546 RepID=UPI001F28CFB3|nr:ABC transporter permease subunit [Membranihabitans marinus]